MKYMYSLDVHFSITRTDTTLPTMSALTRNLADFRDYSPIYNTKQQINNIHSLLPKPLNNNQWNVIEILQQFFSLFFFTLFLFSFGMTLAGSITPCPLGSSTLATGCYWLPGATGCRGLLVARSYWLLGATGCREHYRSLERPPSPLL